MEQKRKETEAAVAKNVGQGKKNRLFGLGKESKFYFYRPNLVAQGKQSFWQVGAHAPIETIGVWLRAW